MSFDNRCLQSFSMCSFQGTGDNSRLSHLWIRTQSVLITDILRISFLEKKHRLSQINLHRRFFFSIKAALKLSNGDKEIRTPDPLLARQVLSQLSYTPIAAFSPAAGILGLSGLEPPTSRLSGVRSNRLSYKPIEFGGHLLSHIVSNIVPSAV